MSDGVFVLKLFSLDVLHSAHALIMSYVGDKNSILQNVEEKNHVSFYIYMLRQRSDTSFYKMLRRRSDTSFYKMKRYGSGSMGVIFPSTKCYETNEVTNSTRVRLVLNRLFARAHRMKQS